MPNPSHYRSHGATLKGVAVFTTITMTGLSRTLFSSFSYVHLPNLRPSREVLPCAHVTVEEAEA